MDISIITTIISILWWILIASITYYLTKIKEQESEWRKEKLKIYIEFIESLSWITDCEWSYENDIKFAKCCNNLYLFAPLKVLSALKIFQKEVAITNTNKSFEKYTQTLGNLISEIRKDIKIKWKNMKYFKVLLWTSWIKNH